MRHVIEAATLEAVHEYRLEIQLEIGAQVDAFAMAPDTTPGSALGSALGSTLGSALNTATGIAVGSAVAHSEGACPGAEGPLSSASLFESGEGVGGGAEVGGWVVVGAGVGRLAGGALGTMPSAQHAQLISHRAAANPSALAKEVEKGHTARRLLLLRSLAISLGEFETRAFARQQADVVEVTVVVGVVMVVK